MMLLDPQCESRTAQRGKYSRAKLFVKKARLACGGSGGGRFAASDPYHAEHSQLGQSRAGDENAVSGGIQIGRRNLDTVVEQGEQVIGDHSFDSFPVAVAQAHPQPIQLWTAEESFALRLEVIRELANEIDGTHPEERNLLMLAVRCEQVDGIGLAKPSGIQIAAQGLFVGEDNDDFLMSRGWGSVFQRNQFVKDRDNRNLRIIKMYVMLSAFCLSTYCFH